MFLLISIKVKNTFSEIAPDEIAFNKLLFDYQD